jgi:formylglycine-generating enzyme required for sulfatase activity
MANSISSMGARVRCVMAYIKVMNAKLMLCAAISLLCAACSNTSVERMSRSTPNTFTIRIDSDIRNGALTAEPSEAPAGSSVTLTITPDENYMLKDDTLRITRVGTTTPLLYDTSYAFTMPNADVVVTAEFMSYNRLFYYKESDGDACMRQILDEAVSSRRFEFPYGLTDNRTETMNHSYWLGDSEVNFELWDTVRQWATAPERGAAAYTFTHDGVRGGGAAASAERTAKHPVTTISWYDAIVWCNALTEWYNAQYEPVPLLTTVYWKALDYAVRDATDTETLNEVTVRSRSGFRLPTVLEWELAARWRDDTVNSVQRNFANDYYTNYFTKGVYASGVNVEGGGDKAAVAVYNVTGTMPAKSKRPNALDLYDMSGNVAEMCFDRDTATLASLNYRVAKGQAWGNVEPPLGAPTSLPPELVDATFGFRVARTHVSTSN